MQHNMQSETKNSNSHFSAIAYFALHPLPLCGDCRELEIVLGSSLQALHNRIQCEIKSLIGDKKFRFIFLSPIECLASDLVSYDNAYNVKKFTLFRPL